MTENPNPADDTRRDEPFPRSGHAKQSPIPPWFGGRPEWMLLHAVRMAMRPYFLFIAAWGAIAGSLGWMLLGMILVPIDSVDQSNDVFSERPLTSQLAKNTDYFEQFPGGRSEDADPLGLSRWSRIRSLVDRIGVAPDNPLTAVPYRIVEPFYQLLQPQPSWSVRLYYLLGGLWTWLVWSLFGGMITHMAVLRFARNQTRSLRDAVMYGVTKIPSHLGAMLLPTLGALLLALPIAFLGLLMRSDFALAILGLFWVIVLPIAAMMAVVVLAWSVGWPLFWSALSSEGMDAFDAFSRSVSYTFQKPLRYLWYLSVAAFGGLLGWLLVWVASESIVQLANYGASLGMGAERMESILNTEMSGAASFGAGFVRFWNGLVRTVGSAFGFSYFWTVMAGIYLLLRYEVDKTEIDEVESESDPVSIYGRVVVPGENEKSAFAKSRLKSQDS